MSTFPNSLTRAIHSFVTQTPITLPPFTTTSANVPSHRFRPTLSIDGLLQALDQYHGQIPNHILSSLLGRVRVTLDELKDAISFSDETYVRNQIRLTRHYEVLILCWKPGQASTIHDHGGSNCAVRVLSGVATEASFLPRADGKLIPTKVERLLAGDVTGAVDNDLHLVANREPEGVNLVTLHVYSKPLGNVKRYTANDVVGTIPW